MTTALWYSWRRSLPEELHKRCAYDGSCCSFDLGWGRFLACQRPAHKTRGLLWEFVGGKIEAGETGKAALIRECREELGITVSVSEVFMDVVHKYPDMTVHLTLYNCVVVEGTLQKLEHNDLRWITVDEIDDYEFCPADEDILSELKIRKIGS